MKEQGSSMRRLYEGASGRTVRRVGLASLACAFILGCTATVGPIQRITLVQDRDGMKMLRPRAATTQCASGFGRRGASELTTRATTALLAMDEEADALVDAEVSVSGWSLGFYRRECVTMVADVVRATRVILLPMPGAHAEHGASCTGEAR